LATRVISRTAGLTRTITVSGKPRARGSTSAW
jgi:hypothetical protein